MRKPFDFLNRLLCKPRKSGVFFRLFQLEPQTPNCYTPKQRGHNSYVYQKSWHSRCRKKPLFGLFLSDKAGKDEPWGLRAHGVIWLCFKHGHEEWRSSWTET